VFVLFLFYRRGKFLSCQDVGPKLLRIAASEDETIKEDGEPDVAKSEEPLACLEPRSLAKAPIVRLLLDSTFARVRLDRKATSISLLVVLGVRADGQKVLLAIKSMGGRAPKLGAPSSTISSACSPSRACRRTNGAVYATQMQSSVCTRNLSDGSRRRRDVVLGAARLHRGLLLCSNHMRRCAAIERQTSSVGRY
jgi:hypothetical protein